MLDTQLDILIRQKWIYEHQQQSLQSRLQKITKLRTRALRPKKEKTKEEKAAEMNRRKSASSGESSRRVRSRRGSRADEQRRRIEEEAAASKPPSPPSDILDVSDQDILDSFIEVYDGDRFVGIFTPQEYEEYLAEN